MGLWSCHTVRKQFLLDSDGAIASNVQTIKNKTREFIKTDTNQYVHF